MPNDLQLYIPRPEDGWFYVKMMSDPETMAYNAPWFPPDKRDGAFVGDVNYHKNPERNRCDMGIVIFASERGKGYGKQGLSLLLDRAFYVDGIFRLHNEFERTRDAGYRIHKALGFREKAGTDGIIRLEMTREEYLRGRSLYTEA